ncbi:MAG: glycosyltransferase family 4 protein [Gloeomargarita sp. SKYG116]|nr:glycosyltransferase family 4 protein [Gloeomargarita sp. SKYG116]MCS7293235.1 glycosyltransferase family 4 protein [Gloeomargarita sp. SKYB120]MDW8178799.1 glycosyltransferase family 4 protein [Gloeomargarita sp. SKYBB_i_bin120]MDW8400564.1 glycosyltransferase family 4 protein [Gloeomargarita sp. SKYGB_i_bin116]
MRIAQIAPLHESVPPKLYGGTERVVYWLTEELVRRGHEVTLFASGDSHTQARLIPFCPQALRLDPNAVDTVAPHLLMVEKVFQMAQEFDVIHGHVDYFPYSLARRHPQVAFLATLHGRLDIPELGPLYEEFRDIPVVSISNAQRGPIPQARWVGTVYHGLPLDLHPFYPQPGDYLAFLGRVSPEKGLDTAIEIATRLGMPLKASIKIDRVDRPYYESQIEPMVRANPLVELIGEITEKEKSDFLGKAYAVLFPIRWPEPFGLVMIEAMACGTPVIAMRCGSVPEVMVDGETGFIVDSVDAAVAAVQKVGELSRQRVRQIFEERFSVERMTNDYEALYQQLLAERTTAPSPMPTP